MKNIVTKVLKFNRRIIRKVKEISPSIKQNYNKEIKDRIKG